MARHMMDEDSEGEDDEEDEDEDMVSLPVRHRSPQIEGYEEEMDDGMVSSLRRYLRFR